MTISLQLGPHPQGVINFILMEFDLAALKKNLDTVIAAFTNAQKGSVKCRSLLEDLSAADYKDVVSFDYEDWDGDGNIMCGEYAKIEVSWHGENEKA